MENIMIEEDYTHLLTKLEYNQLQVFNRLTDFNKIYKSLIIKNKIIFNSI